MRAILAFQHIANTTNFLHHEMSAETTNYLQTKKTIKNKQH